MTDVKMMLKQLKELVKLQVEIQNQKGQLRMLIDSLQNYFNEEQISGEGDSPWDLLKDMFMHVLQEEKHKQYQPDDWFQLINAVH